MEGGAPASADESLTAVQAEAAPPPGAGAPPSKSQNTRVAIFFAKVIILAAFAAVKGHASMQNSQTTREMDR